MEVVPNTWTALVLSTAEALLDSEDKTTMERIYIVVYAKKQRIYIRAIEKILIYQIYNFVLSGSTKI